MLLLIGAVRCIYLLHRSTHKFLGDEVPDRPTPGEFLSAVDFSLKKTDGIGYLAIADRHGQVLDAGGGTDGTLLGYRPPSGQKSQSFRIVLVEDGSYMLVQSGKCLDWDGGRRRFVKRGCRYARSPAVDAYYEVSSIPHADPRGSDADEAPPPGTKERKFYDMIANEQKRRGYGRDNFMKEMEDLSSSDLRGLEENGNSEIREFKKFVAANRPKGSRREESTSLGETSSSSSCDDALEVISRLMQNRPAERGDFRPGAFFAGGFDPCSLSSKNCVGFTRHPKRHPGRKRRRRLEDSSETSSHEEPLDFIRR